MTNNEAIDVIKHIRDDFDITNKQFIEAYNLAIKALEEQEKKEKPVVYDLSKYPLCGARGEALCEALKGDYCTYEGKCPNKGRKRRIRKDDMSDCIDEDAKQASIPYTYNAPKHDCKCGYPDIIRGEEE